MLKETCSIFLTQDRIKKGSPCNYLIFGITVLCSLIAMNSSCRRDKPASAGVSSTDAPTIVSYPDQPSEPKFGLTFTKEVQVEREGWWPQGVLIDPNGRILVPSYRENKVFIFNKSGQELETLEFREGQGPGEFSRIELQVSPEGDLYIYDRLQQRLTVMDAKGQEVKSTLRFGEMRQVFALSPDGNYYFWVVRFRPGTKDVQDLVLTCFDTKGHLVHQIESVAFAPGKTDRSGKRVYGLYEPYGIYKFDRAGRLYVAVSDRYEVTVYSADGSPIRKMKMDTKPRKPTERDLELIQPFFSEFPKDRTVLLPPSQMPEVADILPLSDSSILVITFTPADDSNMLSADWFSPEGRFLCRVQIPGYYQWFKAFGPGASHARIEDDYLYTTESTSEAETDFVVKRYRIIRTEGK